MAEEKSSNFTFENYPYDVTLSYVVDDYQYAHSLAEELQELGIGVYYDEYLQPIKEWAPLYAHLTDLYENKAPYRVVLLSRDFVSQTDLEQEIAQTLILGKDANTISIQLDEVDISIIPSSISCLADHHKQLQRASRKIFQQARNNSPMHSPRNEQSQSTAGLKKTSRDWIDRGVGHYNARRYRQSAAAFDEALRIDPSSQEAKNWKRKLKNLGY